MSENKTNKYAKEFKESAVRLAKESEQSIAQTARELGIKAKILYSWMSKYSNPGEQIMKNTEYVYSENKRLKKELLRVSAERDLLKAAAAYFAKESR